MPYTKETLRADLKMLNASAWMWAGDKPRAQIDLKTGKAPVAPKQDASDEIANYCWCAYEKGVTGNGDLVIGRVNHLQAADLYSKVADILDKQTLLDDSAKGNLLKMDKWSTVVNDSWILGGVHRYAKFRLASPRVMENLWNAQNGFPVVTARELLGLLHFGYRLDQVGPWQIVAVADSGRAAAASLLAYDKLMSDQSSIRNVLKLVDKSKLKPS
jgi:hypothetical protein